MVLCTAAGYTKHTCSICQDSFNDTETAATGHSGGKSTCTELATCEKCGETYGESGGHDLVTTVYAPQCGKSGYTEKTCTNCGYKEIVDGSAASNVAAVLLNLIIVPLGIIFKKRFFI